MYPVSPAGSRHWLRSFHVMAASLATLPLRWTKALASDFSAAHLAETWVRTFARCAYPLFTDSARSAFWAGRDDGIHPLNTGVNPKEGFCL